MSYPLLPYRSLTIFTDSALTACHLHPPVQNPFAFMTRSLFIRLQHQIVYWQADWRLSLANISKHVRL
jgi:hypothetical protein